MAGTILLLFSSKSIIKETISPKATLLFTEQIFEFKNILLFFFNFKSNLSETSNFTFKTSFTLKKESLFPNGIRKLHV